MKRILSLVLIAGLGSACAPRTTSHHKQTASANVTKRYDSKYVGPKRRIGVVEFENKTAYGSRLGTAAADILVTELAKTGRFVVVERDKLNKILDEQKLQASGAIDPRTAVKVGQILGLNAIVTGSISEFGVKKEGSEYVVVQSKRQIAEAVVDIRIVDAETGQVLYADSGTGVAKNKKGSVLGLGGRGGYDETIEGKALRQAIVQFTENIVSQVSKKPWTCRVAGISGDNVYINAGPNMGIEKGQELTCFSLGKKIMDPTTGLLLGHEEEEIGVVRVTGPLGTTGEGSIAKIVKQIGRRPRAKDICRLAD
jgi:curli biogenesis system outer membrane secretion channel CsgG